MKRRALSAAKYLWIAILLLSCCFFLPEKHAEALSLSLNEPGTQVHDGTVGQVYFGSIYLANGTAPYTYQISSGSLPPGLKLGCENGAGFADISGTPTRAGTYTFTVKATDVNNNQGSWQFSVRISEKNTHYNVYVTGGEAQNVYFHAATTFQAGEHITLSWKGYAPAGYCLEQWICPASIDLDQYNCFYMPAEDVHIEAQFTEIYKGSYDRLDTTIAGNGGPCDFNEIEEHTLDAAWKAGLINRTIQYSSNNYAWHTESIENRRYDLDKDGNDDLQLIRVEYSTGGVIRYGGTASGTNLADEFWLSLPDEVIAASETTVYECIEFILEHNLKAVGFTYPTCTADGVKEHYVCIGCGAKYWDAKRKYPVEDPSEVILPATGHNMTHIGGRKPTCTEDGVVEHYCCDDCYKLYYDQAGEYPVASESDLMLEAYGHNLTHVGGKKPTCTEDGVVEHYECSNCHEWFWDADTKNRINDQISVVLKASGHAMSAVPAKEADCTESGNKAYYTCSNCHEWYWDAAGKDLIPDHDSVTIPAKGHSLTYINGSKPTCTDDGMVEHYECSVCGLWFWDEEASQLLTDHDAVVLEVLGHAMERIHGLLPTCTEDGVKEHFVCDNCKEWFWDEEGKNMISDHTEVELPAFGHSMIKISGQKACCTDAGVIEHYECSECDGWFWDAEGLSPVGDHANTVLAALEHEWGEWQTLKEPTASESGLAERICAHDPSHRETKELPAIGAPETIPAEILSISKKMLSVPANGTRFAADEAITYQIRVINESSETLSNVTVRDDISGKEWVIRSLAPGATELFTVEHQVTAEEEASGVFQEMPTEPETEPQPAESTSAESETVPPEAETTPVPIEAETTPAAAQPSNNAQTPTQPGPQESVPPTQPDPQESTAPATKAPEKNEPENDKGGSGVPGWVLIPAIGLGGLSAGLAVALIGKNKARAAATSAAGKAAGAAESSTAKSKKKEE